MKIAMVTPGPTDIPPKHWGAIENIIWNYKLNLEKIGATVSIFGQNTDTTNEKVVISLAESINKEKYDFIHVHDQRYVTTFNKYLVQKYCLTNHNGELAGFLAGAYADDTHWFAESLNAPANIVLSEQIKSLFLKYNYKGFLRVLRNPVETQKFIFKESGNSKAICVGKIFARKRQGYLAQILRNKVNIDFVGPNVYDRGYDPTSTPGSIEFKENETCRYLGPWDKSKLYENLTNYSCLVLYSISEAAPLVVLEAMAAGLNVVVSQSSSANLDVRPFIHVLPDNADPTLIIKTIQTAIKENALYRTQIRDYTVQKFDYSVLAKEYLNLVEEYKNFST